MLVVGGMIVTVKGSDQENQAIDNTTDNTASANITSTKYSLVRTNEDA